MLAAAQQASRFRADDLRGFARTLLERAGVRADIARNVADILLDADLLGIAKRGGNRPLHQAEGCAAAGPSAGPYRHIRP